MFCEPIMGYREKLVVARKPHKCCETKRAILEGEKYWLVQGLLDGEFVTYRQSEAAYHFARKLNGWPSNYECTVPFGGVGEHVAEVGNPELTAEWERVKQGEIICRN